MAFCLPHSWYLGLAVGKSGDRRDNPQKFSQAALLPTNTPPPFPHYRFVYSSLAPSPHTAASHLPNRRSLDFQICTG